MRVSPERITILRFGPFELDPVAGELRKSGLKLRIPAQSLQVLTALVDRPGEIVMREELAGILWHDGTHVDFENGLNAAVKKLRSALGDSGESPRYIETVPRRGYRLLVPVVPLPPPAPESVARRTQTPLRMWVSKSAVGIACAAVVVGSVLLWRIGGAGLRPNVSSTRGWGKASSKPEANAYFAKYELLGGSGMNDLARAREMLGRALSIDPRFGKARVEYGFSCLMMIDGGYSNEWSWLDRAEQEILQGLLDDPAYSRGHSALAAVLLYRGRKETALHEATVALEINPDDVDARQWQAVYYWYSGDIPMARKLEQYNRARNPRFFPTRMNLADMARQEGDWEESLRELTSVLEYDPQNNYVLQRVARTHMDAGRLSIARQTLDRLRPIDRRSFETRSLEALLLALEGRRVEAAKLMDGDVLKYLDVNPLVTLTAAEVYAAMGDTSRANEWMETAINHGDERFAWFTRDPALASLRADVRFQQILRSLTLRRTHQGQQH